MGVWKERAKQEIRYSFYVLFKHKVKFSCAFFAIVAGVTAWLLITPWIYEATAKIIVVFKPTPHLPVVPADADPNTLALEARRQQLINAEMERLRSRTLVTETIQDVGLAVMYPHLYRKYHQESSRPDVGVAVPLFQQALTVKPSQQRHVIAVSFRHPDPHVAAKTVNRLIDHFTDYHSRGNESETDLSRNAQSGNRHLDAVQVAPPNPTTAELLKEKKESLQTQIAETETNLDRTRAQIRENENVLRLIRDYEPGSELPPQLAQEKGLNTDAMSSIRTRLTRLRAREQELRKKYTERNAQVVSVRAEIDEARKLLAQEEKVYFDNTLLSTQANLKQLTAHERTLMSTVTKLQKALAEIQEEEERLVAHERSRAAQMEQANASQHRPFVVVTLAEPAVPPDKPIHPRVFLTVLMAIIFGNIAGLSLAFLWERLMPTIDSPDDVEKHLNLSVLASITKTRS